uniref:Elongation factor Ts, mitochondrial n=1 Tax=Aegilops tauschii TaxID=37682 RepID=R7W2H4_AEGTA
MTPVVHCSVGTISLFHIGSFRPSREIQIRRFRGSERLRTLSAAAVGTDVTVEGSASPSGETSGPPPAAAETTGQAVASKSPASSPPKLGRNPRKSEMPPLKDGDLVPGASFTGKVRSIKPFGVFVDIGAFTEGLVHISRVSDGFVEDISTLFTVGQEVSVKLVEVNKETRRISLTMRTGGDYVKEAPTAPSGGRSPTAAAPRSSPRQTKDFKKIDEAKYTRGQSLTGTVKNTTRTGSFVTLPDGEEGFLPREEEAAALFTLIGHSALEVGQEVTVKVLNVARGQVTLTMKGGEDDDDELSSLNTNLKQGWSRGTNAFELAFRRSKEISAFLDQREKVTAPEVKTEVETETSVSTSGVESAIDDKLVEPPTEVESKEDSSLTEAVTGTVEPPTVSATEVETKEEDSASTEAVTGAIEPPTVSATEVETKEEDSPSTEAVTGAVEEITPVDKAEEPEESVQEVPTTASSESAVVTEEVAASDEKTTEVSAAAAAEASTTTATISPALVKQLRDATGAGMMDCKKALAESSGDIDKAQEFLRKKGLAAADKRAGRATAEGRIGSYIHDSRIGILIELNCETDFVSRGDVFKELVDDLAMQAAACPQVNYISIDDVPEEVVKKETELEMQREDLLSKPEQIRAKIVEGRVKKRLGEFALLEQPFIKNDKVTTGEWVKQTIATIGENMKVRRFVRYNLGEGLEKKSQDFAAEVAAQTAAKPPPAAPVKDDKPEESVEAAEKKPAVAISAALVKQLRDETGAGMMDCKKALAETGGDLQGAQEFLRKKGLSSADKKSSRLTAEGLIGSYIHDNRIGCMIEINSETDFVARNEKFKELVNDLAMQVVACPQVEYVSMEDIPESVVSKEKEIEMQREDLQSKPENIREKIVEGRISKRLGVMALLEQPFIKDDSKTVKDLVKETIAGLGENIKVRRFVRYTLGEN